MALLSTFTDDFPGSTLDTTKWVSTLTGTGTVGVSGGSVTLASGTTASSGANIQNNPTGQTWTFTGSYAYAMVVPSSAITTAGNTHAATLSVVDATSGSSAQANLQIRSANLYGTIYNATGSTATITVATYDVNTMRFLRLRHNAADGVIYAGYSRDSLTWTEIAISGAYPATTWGSATRLQLSVGNGTTASQSSTLFDMINGGNTTLAYGIGVGRNTVSRITGTTLRATARTGTATRTTNQIAPRGPVGSAVITFKSTPSSAAPKAVRVAPATSAITGGGTGTTKTRPTTGQLWPRTR